MHFPSDPLYLYLDAETPKMKVCFWKMLLKLAKFGGGCDFQSTVQDLLVYGFFWQWWQNNTKWNLSWFALVKLLLYFMCVAFWQWHKSRWWEFFYKLWTKRITNVQNSILLPVKLMWNFSLILVGKRLHLKKSWDTGSSISRTFF